MKNVHVSMCVCISGESATANHVVNYSETVTVAHTSQQQSITSTEIICTYACVETVSE